MHSDPGFWIGVFFFVATLVAVGLFLFLFLARSVRAMKDRDARNGR